MSYARDVAIQTAALFAFWMVLSGRTSALFLGMGLGSALLVSLLTADIVAGGMATRRQPARTLAVRAWRFAAYVAWLVVRIAVSSAQVASIVCRPRMPLDPGMARLRTQLASPMARAFLANSITLIPGTMTVSLDGDELTVHVLFPEAADDLASGRMQTMIAGVFCEGPQPQAELTWETPTSAAAAPEGR